MGRRATKLSFRVHLLKAAMWGLFCVLSFVLFSCVTGTRKPASESAPEPIVRTAKLIFIGDVMSHSPQVTAARTADGGYDYSDVFRHVRPIFEEADVVIANLETTLRTSPPYTGYPRFSAPAELAEGMREAGIDIVTMANNHICDKGAGGILSTLALVDSAGLGRTGAFADRADRAAHNPLRFTAGGLRFALLNYTYGTNGLPIPNGLFVNLIDTALIARDLAAACAAGDPDCVIVSYHWGEEYRRLPTAAQRELAAWTRDRGADIVIGGHPHVVEPVEAYYNADSTAIVGATYYSLGNFVSNQRFPHTDGGMMAEITVTKSEPAPAPTPTSPGDAHSVSVPAIPSATSDSLAETRPAVSYDLAYRLFWVDTPVRGGIRRYEVLPSAMADTLPSARRFLDQTRRLLSDVDPAFTELK